jgi:ABC-type transport system involved in multi-copper enzyme maturation permease subunit
VNGTIIRALLQDALYQVLDNRIFRLLMLVVLGLVSPTVLVALRKDEVLILWGWQRISYDQLFDLLPVGPARQAFQDLQGEAIRFYESLIVNWLCGNIGMVFCVAATAFFVPRMLERGSADMLLSKPISRATLLLARYLSGILFVAILTSCLVLGMYLGFLTVSGYHDPGVLWGAVTLVYLFAHRATPATSEGRVRAKARAVLSTVG